MTAPTARPAAPLRTADHGLRWLLAAAAAIAPAPVLSWGSLLLIDAPPSADALALGPALWTVPKYPGAAGRVGTLLPGIDYYARSGFFLSTDTGLGWNLAHRDDLQAGMRLWPQLARRRADLPHGIDAIGSRIQTEAFLNYAPTRAVLLQSAALRGAARHHDGAQFEIGATSGVPIGGDLLAVGLAATWANRAYRQDYFGVSPSAAAASGLTASRAPAGWQDLSLTLSLEHRFTADWHAGAQWVGARLLGFAAGSPLTQSRRQSAATVTLWHDF